MKRKIGWLWFYETWSKLGIFNNDDHLFTYQDKSRIYLDEYDNQDTLRENWFANRFDFISIKGNTSSFNQRFHNSFYKQS